MTQEERKNRYRLLCQEKNITSLFMQPWWLDATGPWDISLGFRNQQLVGAMPFGTGQRLGIKYIGMPPFTHHLPIWMDKPPDISDHKWLTREKQIIWLLIDSLPKHGYFSMVFTEDSFDNWLPFFWKGFRQEVRYTFIIEKADPETIDANINRNLKRNLRHTGSDFTIRHEVDPSSFYKLCAETYKRQKLDFPFSYDAFVKMDAAVTAHHAGKKLGAYTSSGQLIAVAYLLWDHKRAYYFLAGDNEAGRESGASIRLCREALHTAFEEKDLLLFDFCGSMLESITEMRRQFGAKSVPLMKIFRANYKWLDIIYRLTR